MKTSLLTSLFAAFLALSALGQTPSIPPNPGAPALATPAAPASIPPATPPAVAPVAPPPQATIAPVPTVVPTAQPTATANDLQSRIERKVKKGVHISIGDDDDEDADSSDTVVAGHGRDHVRIHSSSSDDSSLMAIPIVGIIFSTLFGAPVMIVGVIMFFSYWRQRQLHRTVRMMVEKGQPVPESLFASRSSPIRQRSDVRRGVVLIMVGLGLMIFFAACNDWEGGSWALGIIPFLIGCGYLLIWKLDPTRDTIVKRSTDNPPPLP